MITPRFTIEQDEKHVIPRIRVTSLHAKLSDAEFHIAEDQFTFFCRPYYLRLIFDQAITEGVDERATYNADCNEVTVWIPKKVHGEVFTSLNNPEYLVATRLQRSAAKKAKITVLSSSTVDGGDGDDQEGDDETLETEYVQTLSRVDDAQDSASEQRPQSVLWNMTAPRYGFGDRFSGIFAALDEETCYDAVELRHPDTTPSLERSVQRIAREQTDFNEDALFYSLADEDGEVAALLHHFVPWYVALFEEELSCTGVAYVAPRHRQLRHTATTTTGGGVVPYDFSATAEEAAVPVPSLLAGGAGARDVPLWEGNIAAFTAPPHQPEQDDASAVPGEGPPTAQVLEDDGGLGESRATDVVDVVDLRSASGALRHHPDIPGQFLAAPTRDVQIPLTMDETETLIRATQQGRSCSGGAPLTRGGPPLSEVAVSSLTVDLLLVYCYDLITTEGSGSSESTWTVCKLSPSLSWLDTPSSVYDACFTFARRCLLYPLHRHVDLVFRCLRDVGVICMLGVDAVVKALVGLKHVLDHSEHKSVLCNLFVTPLLQHWRGVPRSGEAIPALQRIAWQLHQVATMTERAASPSSSSTVLPDELGRIGVCLQELEASAAGAPLNNNNDNAATSNLLEMVQLVFAQQRNRDPITLTTLGLPINLNS